MDPTCPDCGVDGVLDEAAMFNVIYECPECGQQLACAISRE